MKSAVRKLIVENSVLRKLPMKKSPVRNLAVEKYAVNLFPRKIPRISSLMGPFSRCERACLFEKLLELRKIHFLFLFL